MKTKELKQKLSRLQSRAHKLSSDISTLISELERNEAQAKNR